MRTFLCLILGIAALPALAASPFAGRFEEIKKTATPAQLYTFLYALPKGGDLHNHAGGAGRSEWWYAAAVDPKRNGGDTLYTQVRYSGPADTAVNPTAFRTLRQYGYDQLSAAEKTDFMRLDALTPQQKQDWLDSQRLDRPGEGREEFFSKMWPRRGQMGSNIHIALEVLVENMKAFGAEHLRYLETQFDGFGYADNTGKPISVEDGVALIRARLAQSDAIATGVTVRFQETVIRFRADAEKELEDLYLFVSAHPDLWVGLNMAGIEENGKGYPLRFLEKMRELRRTHPAVALSIHAGEMDGPDKHIRDTLLLGATRIGHGVNLIQDPETLLLLQQTRRVLVEVNLISNRLLEYVPDLSKHPFPEYLRTGVPVCLNTDDRGMWDSNLTDEYYTAVTTFNLDWDEIEQIGHNSLAFSFVQPEVKTRLIAEFDRAMQDFAAKYAPADSLRLLGDVHPVTYGYGKRNWNFPFAQ
ncbi:MAG TPA: hypothetical protein VHD32_10020 [Candidatus Didemnitutus sp.]|nr:hypothetical protein [Candidatus Didemnitutus sp.]